MTLAQTEIQRRTGKRPKITLGGVRLALGVVAILALAAVGITGGKPAAPTPETALGGAGPAAGQPSAPLAPLDGRGKWGGYMR